MSISTNVSRFNLGAHGLQGSSHIAIDIHKITSGVSEKSKTVVNLAHDKYEAERSWMSYVSFLEFGQKVPLVLVPNTFE